MSIQSREYHKAWRDRNKAKIHGYYVRDYAKRKEALRAKRADPEARKKLSEYLKEWREQNKAKSKSDNAAWVANNKEWIKEYRRSYGNRRRFLYSKRKHIICARKRELSKLPKNRKRCNDYQRRKRREDIQFCIRGRLRATMVRALRRQFVRKSKTTMELVGCTPAELRSHIESLFKPGMTWQNRNLWHVDHKIPLASFDLRDLGQQKLAFHFTNLQPLWAWENQEKSDKVE